jgi:glutamate dehydrogenase (NAD(P)+)
MDRSSKPPIAAGSMATQGPSAPNFRRPNLLNAQGTSPEQEFQFADDLGPGKILHLYDPATDLKAIVVVDNVVRGPAIGGVRMASDVTTEEVFRLARSMTLKNAAADLPHGGGKSAILANPKLPLVQKERLMRAFAQAIRHLHEYIPGPDMGTDEQCMAWVKAEIGRAVGLPREMGGIPLDKMGATGFGVAIAAEVASSLAGLNLQGARVVIQGFGSVGKHAARFLAERGAILIGASDSRGTIFNPKGIDVAQLIALKEAGGSVIQYSDGKSLDQEAVVDLDCDLWIPAARPDVVRAENADRLRTRLVIQGANIPFTLEAEQICHERNILIVPDFIANAGGVICGAVEYSGGDQNLAFQTIADKIRTNTQLVIEPAVKTHRLPRQVALDLARERIRATAKG